MAIIPVSPEARSLSEAIANIEARLTAIEVGLRTGQLGNSSLEGSGLNAYDSDGNLRYTIGLQDDGTYAGISTNNPNPPPVPSQPVLEPGIASIKVTYEGETNDGVGLPKDWSHSNIYVQPPSGTWTKVGTLLKYPDTFTVAPLEYIQYNVALTNVNYSGKESDKGPSSQATPTQVVGQDVLDGIITETKLASDAVTAAKIAADAVGTGKIQNGAVDLSKLADGSVDGSKIIDGAVGAGKIAAEAVGTNELAANSIVSGKIAANAIESVHITAGAVSAGKLAVDSVQAGNIVSEAVTASKIQALAVTSDKIAANAVTAGNIQAGAVTAAKLQSDLVIASRIIAGDPAGARAELHPTAGFQLWDSSGNRMGWWDAATGNVLITGTYQSGLSGERINILPDGTMRFYYGGGGGSTYSAINNNGSGGLSFSGPVASGNRPFMELTSSRVGIWYGQPTGTRNAQLSVNDRNIDSNAPVIGLRVNHQYSTVDGFGNRIVFIATDSSGNDVGSSILHYMKRPIGSIASLYAPQKNCGLIWDTNAIGVTTGDTAVNGPIVASAFNPPSSRTYKMNEKEPEFVEKNKRISKFSDIVKLAPSKQWQYRDPTRPEAPDFKYRKRNKDTGQMEIVAGEYDAPAPKIQNHWGPMAEDLALVHPDLVTTLFDGKIVTDLRDLIGVLWKVVEELVDRIETLEGQGKPAKTDSPA